MKAIRILLTGLIAISFAAAPVSAQEQSGKRLTNFSPPPGSYKQISPNEARNMRNHTSPDQEEVSITLERVDGNLEERDKK